MTKSRRSVTLEPDVDEYLSQDGVNASELVNDLVKNHLTGGGDKQAMLELRKEQVNGEIDNLKQQLKQKEEELATIEERLTEYRTQTEDVVKEASERLRGAPLEPSNPGVQNWAEQAGLTETELIEEIKDYRSESGSST